MYDFISYFLIYTYENLFNNAIYAVATSLKLIKNTVNLMEKENL